MVTKIVTIQRFSQPIEAELAKTALESAGIRCFLQNAYTVGVNWLWSNAIGGVELQVKQEDVDDALAILQHTPDSIDAVGCDIRCPRCGSENVSYEAFSRRSFFLSWLLSGVAIPIRKRSWKCSACKHSWKSQR